MSVYKLKPCECGNTSYVYLAIPIFGGVLCGYECPACGRRTKWCSTRDEAVEAWNGRTE